MRFGMSRVREYMHTVGVRERDGMDGDLVGKKINV